MEFKDLNKAVIEQVVLKLKKATCNIHKKSAKIYLHPKGIEISNACCKKFEDKLHNLFADEYKLNIENEITISMTNILNKYFKKK